MNYQLEISFSKLLYALAGSLTILGLAACDNQVDEAGKQETKIVRPVKTIVAKATSDSLERMYPATVLASNEADLSFRVPGRIIDLPIRASQKVKEGDVIAQLDKRDFQSEVDRLSSQIEQAKAQLSAMESGARTEDVAALKASVAAAQAQFTSAQKQLQRTQTLFKKGIVAKARLEQDQSAAEVAKAQLEAAEQELKKGRAGSRKEEVAAQRATIKGAETQLKAAQDALSDATLRAPFDGIIAKRNVENFTNIQANQAIAVIQALKQVDLTFDVPAPDVPKLAAREGTLQAVVRLDGLPGKQFDAKLTEFSTQADTSTQTYRGRVSITPPENVPILPGMAGTLEIKDRSGGKANKFLIPLTAVSSEADGAPFIWVVESESNTVTKRSVTLGEATGINVSVAQGLSEGDVVVTAGVAALLPGMQVRPISNIAE